MRLVEMKDKLEKLIENLSLEVEELDGKERVRITDSHFLSDGILEISKFGFIDSEFNTIKEKFDVLLLNKDEQIIVHNSYYNNYKNVINRIKDKVSTVIKALENTVSEQEETTISVKLPPYTELKEISTFISDMEKILQLILPPNNPSNIKLKSFDVGSNWLDIILSTMEHVQVVADFVNSMVELVQVTILGSAKTIQELRKISSNEEEEIIQELEKRMKRRKIEEHVERLISEKLIRTEGMSQEAIEEYKSSLIKAFEMYEPYVVDGAEIQPALNAPEKIEESFPKEEKMKELQNIRNQLLIEHDSKNDQNEESINNNQTNEFDNIELDDIE